MFAPLIKTPPPHTHTHNTTLHTGLMLTRGISAFVVGSQRRRIITHDLDIYKCALQIQHQLDPPSSILPVGILYLLPYMTLTKQLLKVALTHVPLKVVLKLPQLFVKTIMTIYIYIYIYIYMGGIEYHITTNLAIVIVSLCHYTCGTPKKTLYE